MSKVPGGGFRGRDIDDAHAERHHGRKLAEALGETPKGPAPRKPGAKRPGLVLDSPGDQQTENVADPEAAPDRALRTDEESRETQRRVETTDKDGRRRRSRPELPPEEDPDRPKTTAAHLAFADDHRRSLYARKMGFDQTPGFDEAVEALLAEDEPAEDAATLAEMLPSSRAHAHPDLPEAEVRPPDFLSPLQAMKDVYMKVKGRASRKTSELLEGYELEDMLGAVRGIYEDESLSGHPEAKLRGPLFRELKADPGPLLLGLNDPRLTEVWRLFIDGWDIWVPDGRDDGVELFWEGEAEDEAGEPMEILQTLAYVEGEVVLSTRLGPLEDELVFDGSGFYRLETKKALPRKEG